jgi:hypothetical protein
MKNYYVMDASTRKHLIKWCCRYIGNCEVASHAAFTMAAHLESLEDYAAQDWLGRGWPELATHLDVWRDSIES